MRQQDALFCHTRDLGEILEDVFSQIRNVHGEYHVLSVGVSKTPRRVKGSYMPCFLAGVSVAKGISLATRAPLFCFSHQEGHIEAARQGALREGRELTEKSFLAFHLSGGTTELLLVEEEGFRYQARLLAGALDLTSGQLIDRCGVKMGLSFPAGKELESLALNAACKPRIRVPKKEDGINLSGFENRFEAQMREGKSKEDLARYVFAVTEQAVETLLEFSPSAELPVLFSGGVSSSRILREHFSGPRYFFAPPEYCADNAIGIAYLARKGAQDGSESGIDGYRPK